MKIVKTFNQFVNEKILNKIKISIDELLDIIDQNELNLLKTFKLDGETVTPKDNISTLYDDAQFNRNLDDKKLKKSKLHDTKDNQTLLEDNIILRFFFVYPKGSIELEEPKYIIIQYFDRDTNEISDIKIFENKDSINKFYETLTDKTIELKKGKKEFIYQTSNSGNNWDLKNPKQVKGDFKSELDFEEMDDLLKDKKVKLNK